MAKHLLYPDCLRGPRCGPMVVVLLLNVAAVLQAQTRPPLASRVDPKAQALLGRAIQALGGPAFLNMKTLTTHGRIFSISDGVTQGFVMFDAAMEFPDKRRLSYGFGKKKSITLINHGEQGWELDRYGIVEQNPRQTKAWAEANHFSLENFLRLCVHEQGVLLLAGGQDLVDNHPALIVEMVDAKQVQIKFYINSMNYLPIRLAYKTQNPKTHEWEEYADSYSEYREFDGVQVPTHLIRYLNEHRVAETFRISAKVNDVYPADYFSPAR